MKKYTVFAILLCFLSSSCEKDKLTGELDEFEGKYSWSYSKYKEELWTAFRTRTPDSEGYTAQVEMTDRGKIIFYINDEEIHKTGFSIVNQEITNNGQSISLEINPVVENTKEIDLNNTLGLTLTGDTLYVDDFPGESYDSSNYGQHYFLRE